MRLLPIRGTDKFGSGAFNAPRGHRNHHGIDLSCYPGTRFTMRLAGLDEPGIVTKLGYPYEDNPRTEYKETELRYIQVSTPQGIDLRFFYIKPMVQCNDFVTIDTVLGVTQSLQLVYNGITNHVHFEVKHGAAYLDPTRYIESHS